MEEMYGAEVFPKMWEAWVDGMSGYAQRPEGREPAGLLSTISPNPGVLESIPAAPAERQEHTLEEERRENASLNDDLLCPFFTRNHKLNRLMCVNRSSGSDN